MKTFVHIFIFIILSLNGFIVSSQNIELFEQFNGRYDYVAIGITLN